VTSCIVFTAGNFIFVSASYYSEIKVLLGKLFRRIACLAKVLEAQLFVTELAQQQK